MIQPTPRPLARSLDPLPGESLAGLLLRLSYRMGVTPHRLAMLCGLTCRSDSIPQEQLRGLSPEAAEQLARVAHLTVPEVQALTLQELTRTYPPLAKLRTGKAGLGSKSHIDWATNPDSRYCPHCLGGNGSPVQQAFGGAWQLCWHLPVTFACTQHLCLLESTCPQCAQPISGRVVRRYSLVRTPHVSGLHPGQCRNLAPGPPPKPRARATPCGARLDAPGDAAALPPLDMQRILDLQHSLNLRLALGQLRGPADEQTPQTYFADLITTARLITLSWPMGASFLPSTTLTDLVDEYATPYLHNPAQRGIQIQRSAPRGTAQTSALLLAAATVLGDRGLVPLRERIEPLTREVYRRSTSIGHKLFKDSDASANLLRATAPRIYGFQKRSTLRVVPKSYRFGTDQIPPLLPLEWFDAYFKPLMHHLPPMTTVFERHLRWAGSFRLAELVCGGTWRACAETLGIPRSSASRTMNVLGKQLTAPGLWPVFEDVIDEVARHLHAQDSRVNYARRRLSTADWCLSPADWKTLCEGIPGLEQRQATGDPQVGEAVIWCMVNQSSYLHSPTVSHRRSSSRSPHRLTEQVGLFANRKQRRPSYATLRHRLLTYATQLARACDDGTDLGFEASSWATAAAVH
ncbi:TniQ family protein [Streptomyces lunaelactis]|uniref:TniQ family protein n=1 Tax=Streptomyces lunaelactis TaxID=1535768 RepID=UPI001584CBA4|nr:TniQ family protein [Streptomyces lunaelactis]NUK06837.1 TniQ family protein [Streptomyces lunaelactis]NUK70059.1 TniQ family protein [Streptomyces lunaelactis]NUK77482.1 TniQ family protein [Streptomyces lunaelactis]NUL09901.1 TniQ family protein [Streptomyces lunaelactis]NUL21143.1 TniQ family protein [Streptomyces lunaelactis]